MNWKQIRQEIIKRDGRCTHCGKEHELVVHHRDLDKKNNTSINLITLCRNCHKKLHHIYDIYLAKKLVSKVLREKGLLNEKFIIILPEDFTGFNYLFSESKLSKFFRI